MVKLGSAAFVRDEEKARFCDTTGRLMHRFLLAAESEEFLAVGQDPHWAAWFVPGDLDIRVRLNVADPRITVTGVAALGLREWNQPPAPVRAAELRSIPLGRLEDVLNDYRLAWALSESLGSGELDFNPASNVYPNEVFELPAAPPPDLDFGITGISDDPRPDEFYLAVAAAWATAIANRQKEPAGVIAEANGVPTSTVHRWIREARRRHLMAPSSRALHADRRNSTLH